MTLSSPHKLTPSHENSQLKNKFSNIKISSVSSQCSRWKAINYQRGISRAWFKHRRSPVCKRRLRMCTEICLRINIQRTRTSYDHAHYQPATNHILQSSQREKRKRREGLRKGKSTFGYFATFIKVRCFCQALTSSWHFVTLPNMTLQPSLSHVNSCLRSACC